MCGDPYRDRNAEGGTPAALPTKSPATASTRQARNGLGVAIETNDETGLATASSRGIIVACCLHLSWEVGWTVSHREDGECLVSARPRLNHPSFTLQIAEAGIRRRRTRTDGPLSGRHSKSRTTASQRSAGKSAPRFFPNRQGNHRGGQIGPARPAFIRVWCRDPRRAGNEHAERQFAGRSIRARKPAATIIRTR